MCALKIYEMAYSVEQNLNSTVELLVHVMSSVECSSLHHDYITGLNALCNNALWVSHACSLLTFGSSVRLRSRLLVKWLLHMLIGCFTHTTVFTVLHGMPVRTSREKAVCLSVCLSVRLSVCQTRGLWQNRRKFCPDFYTQWKIIYPSVFWEEEWLVGRPLLSEISGQTDPIGAKMLILNRYSLDIHSAITPSKKSLVNTNRKYTMHLLMSLRWTLYVAHKPSNGVLKNPKRPFFI